MKITRVIGREIYDSLGWPTVQCELFLDSGASVLASVPAGTSKGIHEAFELRDGGTRLHGKGVHKAIETIEHIIAPILVGRAPEALEMDLQLIELDGTENKSRLGANTLLAVSMALYRAEALVHNLELYEFIAYLMDFESVAIPFPLLNVINGGAHASNNLAIQEFMIVPIGTQTFRAAFESGVLVYHELGELLKAHNKSTAVGYEGGYASTFANEFEALDFLLEAIQRVNSKHAGSCIIALDIAASHFYDVESGLYTWHGKKRTRQAMIELYQELIERYPIYSIEDPLAQDDWDGWQEITKLLGNKTQIIGDDLFATKVQRIEFGSSIHAATSAIIKPNQVGTISEALQAIMVCKKNNLMTIISHRSADTEDTFIADLAVGANAGQIKSGGCSRSERIAKYNRLLAIEDTLTLS